MRLMQHNHIPQHTYKTNLSVPAGLSKTHNIINCLQAPGLFVSLEQRGDNTNKVTRGQILISRANQHIPQNDYA